MDYTSIIGLGTGILIVLFVLLTIFQNNPIYLWGLLGVGVVAFLLNAIKSFLSPTPTQGGRRSSR